MTAQPHESKEAEADLRSQEAKEALRCLHLEVDKLDDHERDSLLAHLGYSKSNQKRNVREKKTITEMHNGLVQTFKDANILGEASDGDILVSVTKEPRDLSSLLSQGKDDKTILHRIFEQTDELSDLEKLKPLILFLLRIHPDLPKVIDTDRKTPLYSIIQATVEVKVKTNIVHFLCGSKELGGLGSSAAIESLGMRTKSSRSSHAIHKAVDEDVSIDKGIVCSKELLPCLEMHDDEGMTCLHKALTPPYSDCKRDWAKTLVEVNYQLLQFTSDREDSDDLTPLQHMIEAREAQTAVDKKTAIRSPLADAQLKQGKKKDLVPGSPRSSERPEMMGRKTPIVPFLPRGGIEQSLRSKKPKADAEKALEDWLKRYCLTKFNNTTARRIMYKPEKMRQVDFSCIELGDVVSRGSLKTTLRHYKLDQTLRCVYIPRITVKWDEDCTHVKKLVDSWGCVGRTDYYMIFDWLKNIVQVEKVLQIVVDDFEDQTRSSHADDAIVECLRSLEVETWDWRRMDISSELIHRAAGHSVKEVYLYCNGNNAVLRSWSETRGLVKLSRLQTVHLKVNQGLESRKTIERYIADFVADLRREFAFTDRKIDVYPEITPSVAKIATDDTRTSKMKEEGEDGYEEQEWLRCMDKFADFIEEFEISEPSQNDPIKVAIIDDGVKSSYAGLDANIDEGESWVQQAKRQDPHSPYNTSAKGHGTVMAYYIRRVCPKVRLYVAKLDPRLVQGRLIFSIESAAEAIEWAVKKQVHVISMSWAIEEITTMRHKDDGVDKLGNAISEAIRNKILLFCAMPDKGVGVKNNTYPKSLRRDGIFSIGAATRDGHPWSRTGDEKPDFYLPGVELGIPTERADPGKKDRPPEKWHTYSGSSLSCALASGLAALILYCATIVDREAKDREYLRGHKGMKEAFENINVSVNRWLRVSTLFGETAISEALRDNDKQKVLHKLVDKFLSQRRLNDTLAKN